MEKIVGNVMEFKLTEEKKAMRSDIAFDGFYRIYKNDTGISLVPVTTRH